MAFNDADDTLTVSVTGLYAVSGYIVWDSNPTGRRVAQIAVNGVEKLEDSWDAVTSGRTAQSITTLLELRAGDEVSMTGQQLSGAGLGTSPPGNLRPELNVYWVSPVY